MLTLWRQGDWEVECDLDGGRLTRVCWRGHSLLTGPHMPGGTFTPPDPKWGEYETRPVFGYDDCWPSLEVSLWPGRDRTVRDHGEVCWLPWEIDAGQDALRGTVADSGGEWSFARVLSCDAGALRFDFTVANTGSRPLAMSWAGHALAPPGNVRYLDLPTCRHIRWEWPQERATGDTGVQSADVWPFLRELEGQAVMLVLDHCAAPVVTVGLDGARWTLAIEGVERPSLGLWYNPGAYPPEPGLEREEFGLEWMLTPECSLQDAAANGNAMMVAPRDELRWAVTWSVKETL
ncbi:MAG: hypothetical protein HPY44_20245 [Armatimonadetes bacterium]|nr:hypothetical protein [Armatimonadota bacterium]